MLQTPSTSYSTIKPGKFPEPKQNVPQMWRLWWFAELNENRFLLLSCYGNHIELRKSCFFYTSNFVESKLIALGKYRMSILLSLWLYKTIHYYKKLLENYLLFAKLFAHGITCVIFLKYLLIFLLKSRTLNCS